MHKFRRYLHSLAGTPVHADREAKLLSLLALLLGFLLFLLALFL